MSDIETAKTATRLSYEVSHRTGWHVIGCFEGQTKVGDSLMVKTKDLADRIADDLNLAYGRGLDDGAASVPAAEYLTPGQGA